MSNPLVRTIRGNITRRIVFDNIELADKVKYWTFYWTKTGRVMAKFTSNKKIPLAEFLPSGWHLEEVVALQSCPTPLQPVVVSEG